jgi:hypothetical protein
VNLSSKGKICPKISKSWKADVRINGLKGCENFFPFDLCNKRLVDTMTWFVTVYFNLNNLNFTTI